MEICDNIICMNLLKKKFKSIHLYIYVHTYIWIKKDCGLDDSTVGFFARHLYYSWFRPPEGG